MALGGSLGFSVTLSGFVGLGAETPLYTVGFCYLSGEEAIRTFCYGQKQS